MGKTGILISLGLGLLGCGGRAAEWDSQPRNVQSLGLSGSVAVLDPSLHRLLMFTSPSGLELASTEINLGINPSMAQTDFKRERLFVLSKGVEPRRNRGDEWPSFLVVDGGTVPRELARYELGQISPPSGLAVDPEGAWAVLYQPPQGTQGASQSGILSNPNELILLRLPPAGATVPVDTTQGDYQPHTLTLQSILSQPRTLSFTPELDLGGQPHRLLVVQTEHEVVLVDLNDPDLVSGDPALVSQTTITAPDGSTGQPGTPVEVVVYPETVTVTSTSGQPEAPPSQQGLLGLRLTNDSNVVVYTFWISNGDITPVPNMVDVAGIPSDIEFVQVAAGQPPMLAALVPRGTGASGGSFATLIDTATATTQRVDLADAYTHLELVTQELGDATSAGVDKALLWGEAASSIGFWSLESALGTPYRSVDAYPLPFKATSVQSVVRDSSDPDSSRDYSHLKLVEAGQQKTFYVVDLKNPAAPPIQVSQPQFQLVVSPDGQRAWAFVAGSVQLGKLDFEDLHATSLTLERAVTGVCDILQPGPAVQVDDSGNSGQPRVMVALHNADMFGKTELGATVLDVRSPDAAHTKFHSGLLLRGLP